MLTDARIAPSTRRIALIVALLCLLLIACGNTTDSATSLVSSADAPLPTAIPTTPPLSLPPEDNTLPALAPLPAALAVAATDTPAAPTAVVAAATIDPTPAAVDQLGVEPAAGTAAADPEPTTAPVVAAQAVSVSSVDSWSTCVVTAAADTTASVLLDPIAQGTATDLSSVQLNDLAAAAASCDIVAASLAETDLGDHVGTASACLNAWLESSAGGSVFVGLASIGWQQATPVWAQPQLIDALDACFTGASFAADVLAVVATNASLNGAFDAACLATSFDSSGTMRAFAQSLANAPAASVLYVSLSDSWVLNCANVGQMVAAAAAADGVGLSPATVSCIDTELKSTGALAQLVAGTADTDAVGIATIACLTDAEASALLG